MKREYENIYNCGGYALGTKDWFIPYDVKNNGLKSNFNKNDLAELTNFMQDIFTNVRLVRTPKDALRGERLIAFRLAENDFHFVKVNKRNNTFMHKMGWLRIEEMPKEEFYNTMGWGCRYNSEIKYFAIKGKVAIYKDGFKEICTVG